MATNANWTVIFDDKTVIKNYAEGADEGIGYVISDNSFWSDSKFSNIWAIQHGTAVTSDEVEYRDTTPHSSYTDANIGDINQFSSKWDSAHLVKLQSNWDKSNLDGETDAEKITRLGARPTSYSST
jgi:hypothetical protein|tara:strand:- start:1211 stop:1588 length:378 start_codon:yes stop_codon:yes gene_type:complete